MAPATSSLRARHYATGQPIEVRWAEGIIQDVLAVPAAERVPGTRFIAPPFFDIQINGRG